MSGDPTKPQRTFGVVTITGKKCAFHGCDGDPVAAMAWRTPEDPASVMWACTRHAQAAPGALQAISPTCGYGHEAPCGPAATCLAIVGVVFRGSKTVRLVSVCDRHAELF